MATTISQSIVARLRMGTQDKMYLSTDEILPYVGEFGRFQKGLVALLFLIYFVMGYQVSRIHRFCSSVFGEQNFRHQVRFSAVLSAEILSDKVPHEHLEDILLYKVIQVFKGKSAKIPCTDDYVAIIFHFLSGFCHE